jgi:hypothetical protein
MLANLLLLFSFQVNFGFLYHKIGLLISFFMAGIAVASIILSRKIKLAATAFNLFAFAEASVILFLFILMSVIKTLEAPWAHPILIFATGFFVGFQFPLAGNLYLKGNKGVGETAGSLYFSDLFGGWIAGMLGAAVFLPILGIEQACIVMIALKVSSLLILLFSRKALI